MDDCHCLWIGLMNQWDQRISVLLCAVFVGLICVWFFCLSEIDSRFRKNIFFLPKTHARRRRQSIDRWIGWDVYIWDEINIYNGSLHGAHRTGMEINGKDQSSPFQQIVPTARKTASDSTHTHTRTHTRIHWKWLKNLKTRPLPCATILANTTDGFYACEVSIPFVAIHSICSNGKQSNACDVLNWGDQTTSCLLFCFFSFFLQSELSFDLQVFCIWFGVFFQSLK